MQNFAIIIQARMSSTRMPGKVLLPFYEEKHILGIQINRLKAVFPDLSIIVATTENPTDDSIANACKELEVGIFRGSETDVLQRFIDCAEKFNADRIMRVCSDNPFLDAHYAQQLISLAEQHNVDYLSYKDDKNTAAIKTHWGLFTEIVSTAALKKASKATSENLYHEHVTNYIYGHPERFRVKLIAAPKEIFHRHDLRYTIDTPEDFAAAQELYALCPNSSLKELIRVTDEREHIKTAMKSGIDKFSK